MADSVAYGKDVGQGFASVEAVFKTLYGSQALLPSIPTPSKDARFAAHHTTHSSQATNKPTPSKDTPPSAHHTAHTSKAPLTSKSTPSKDTRSGANQIAHMTCAAEDASLDSEQNLIHWNVSGNNCFARLVHRRSRALCKAFGEVDNLPSMAFPAQPNTTGEFGCDDRATIWTNMGCSGIFECGSATDGAWGRATCGGSKSQSASLLGSRDVCQCHPFGPLSSTMLPGNERYAEAIHRVQVGKSAASLNARSSQQSWCSSRSSSSRVERAPTCHTLLFHGVLSEPCLALRNLTASDLPCVRSLLVTTFPGSASLAMATMLQAAHNSTVVHENHPLETDVLVSWSSRTDAWRLASSFSSGEAHDPAFRKRPYGIVGRGMHKVDWPLSRCLYQRVLVQTREPLAAIRSTLVLSVRYPAYDVLADQLLARSDAALLSECKLPVRPVGSCWNLAEREARQPLVTYLTRRWVMWMSAALDVADGRYAIEQTGTNASHVCKLGRLASCKGSVAGNGATSKHHDHRTEQIHSHSSHDEVPPLTWEELCRADHQAARRALALATEHMGYSYDPATLASIESQCVRRPAPPLTPPAYQVTSPHGGQEFEEWRARRAEE